MEPWTNFIGDAMMAFWNAPLSVPNHALEATLAALEMLKTLEQLNDDVFIPEFNLKLAVGMGIHTGIARVGNMGSDDLMDYTVLGDTVNTASRLEGLSKFYKQQLILSEATREEILTSPIPTKHTQEKTTAISSRGSCACKRKNRTYFPLYRHV